MLIGKKVNVAEVNEIPLSPCVGKNFSDEFLIFSTKFLYKLKIMNFLMKNFAIKNR